MNPTVNRETLLSAGRNLVSWLTVLQIVGLLSALATFVLAALPGNPGAGAEAQLGVSGAAALGLGAAQLIWTVLYALALQWAKGWLGGAGRWAGGEGAPGTPALTRQTRLLSGFLTLGQWLPLIAALLLLPTIRGALNGLGSADLTGTDPSGQLRNLNLTPEQLRAAARLSLLLTLVAFGVPAFVINFAVLGWIRRWMRGVTQVIQGLDSQPRLPALAATTRRWFTFFQGLLVFFILLILLVPLLGAPSGVGTGLGGRLNLLLTFLNLALLFALLRWSKVVLAGVTARAAETN